MSVNLVVQVPFWDYARGDIITDSAEIEKVLEHHHHFVTQVAAIDASQPPITSSSIGGIMGDVLKEVIG